jgi:hypothetical protein
MEPFWLTPFAEHLPETTLTTWWLKYSRLHGDKWIDCPASPVTAYGSMQSHDES